MPLFTGILGLDIDQNPRILKITPLPPSAPIPFQFKYVNSPLHWCNLCGIEMLFVDAQQVVEIAGAGRIKEPLNEKYFQYLPLFPAST